MNEESGLFRPCPDRPANSNPRCYRGGGRPADRFQGHRCSTLMTGDRVEIRIPPAPNPTSKKTSWTPPSPQGTRREGGRRVEHPLLCLCQGAGRHTWIRAFASGNARDKQGSSPEYSLVAADNGVVTLENLRTGETPCAFYAALAASRAAARAGRVPDAPRQQVRWQPRP